MGVFQIQSSSKKMTCLWKLILKMVKTVHFESTRKHNAIKTLRKIKKLHFRLLPSHIGGFGLHAACHAKSVTCLDIF